MGDSGPCTEDQNVDRNADRKGCAQQFSGGKKNTKESTGNFYRGHPCYILADNISLFCPCPETLGGCLKVTE